MNALREVKPPRRVVFDWARWGLLFLLSICVFSTLRLLRFSPIFTDETVYLTLYGRVFSDGALLQPLLSDCYPKDFLSTRPMSLLPGAVFNSIAYSLVDSAQGLRFFGTTLFFLWLLSLIFIARARGQKFLGLQTCLLLFVPLTGDIPFLGASARPETALALGLNILVLIGLHAEKIRGTLAWIIGISLFLLPSILFCLHPKIAFWIPVLVLCGHYFFRGPLRLLYFAWLSLVLIQSAFFYGIVLRCPGVLKIDQELTCLNLLNGLRFSDLNHVIPMGLRSVSETIQRILISTNLESDSWTGFDKMFFAPRSEFRLGATLAFLSILLFLVCELGRSSLRLIRKDFPPHSSLALALIVSLLTFSFTQRYLTFYYTLLPILLLLTTSALCLGEGAWKPLKNLLTLALVFNAITTCWFHLTALGVELPHDLGMRWTQGIPSPQYFADATRDAGENDKIRRFAESCQLADNASVERLIVDEQTYFAFQETRFLVLAQNTWDAFGYPGPTWERLKSEKRYAGLVTRCFRLPEEVRSQARADADGNYCCARFSDPE